MATGTQPCSKLPAATLSEAWVTKAFNICFQAKVAG